MPKEEITIEIDKQGDAVFSVKGVRGSGCKKLTEDIQDALGETTSSTNTSEFAQAPVQQAQKAVQR